MPPSFQYKGFIHGFYRQGIPSIVADTRILQTLFYHLERLVEYSPSSL
jgi:hypothetical protein